MVELYKMDCEGKLYFCDYGLPHKVEDYRLRGYIVKRAVRSEERRPIPQRGEIHITHRKAKKVGWTTRFVNDCKHNIQVFKEIGQMFGLSVSKRTKARQAKEYFATRAVAAVA